jgi:hypothetical protein
MERCASHASMGPGMAPTVLRQLRMESDRTGSRVVT